VQLEADMENDFGRLPEGKLHAAALAALRRIRLDSESRSDQLCAVRHRVTKYRHKYTFPLDDQARQGPLHCLEPGLAAADPKCSRRQHRARQRHRCSEAPLDIPAVGWTLAIGGTEKDMSTKRIVSWTHHARLFAKVSGRSPTAGIYP
jgi:hypothetical protein